MLVSDLHVIAVYMPYSTMSIHADKVYTDVKQAEHECDELKTNRHPVYADVKFQVMALDDFIVERASQGQEYGSDSFTL